MMMSPLYPAIIYTLNILITREIICVSQSPFTSYQQQKKVISLQQDNCATVNHKYSQGLYI